MKRLFLLAIFAAACSRTAETPLAKPAAPAKPVATASSTSTPPPATTTVIPRSSTGVLDACSLISTDDLKRITGSTFKAGVNSTTTADVMRCTFPREGGGGISIFLHLKDVAADYRSMAGMTRVPGIPDEAWWSPEVTTFVDRKGSRVLVVGFNFAGGEQKKWGEEIVREILPKL